MDEELTSIQNVEYTKNDDVMGWDDWEAFFRNVSTEDLELFAEESYKR